MERARTIPLRYIAAGELCKGLRACSPATLNGTRDRLDSQSRAPVEVRASYVISSPMPKRHV